MRTSLKKILLLFAATALWAGGAIAEDNPIVLGIPVGLSGANSIVAPSMVQAAELAVSEINAAGGILNRKLALEVADDGSGAAGAQKAYDSLVFQKKVDAIAAMETTAARNAGLPIITRGKSLTYIVLFMKVVPAISISILTHGCHSRWFHSWSTTS